MKRFLTVLSLSFSSLVVSAIPPPPPGSNNAVPIDGIELLLGVTGCVIMLIYALKQKRRLKILEPDFKGVSLLKIHRSSRVMKRIAPLMPNMMRLIPHVLENEMNSENLAPSLYHTKKG